MENTTKISVSAVTHIGTACAENDDRLYANGKFTSPGFADYSQISLEVNDEKCLFAISDGMEDEDSGISLISDLGKYHQRIRKSSKDILVKLDDLVLCVEQASNLLHSASLGESGFKERKTAFAGLLINDGRIAAVNMGNCKIYKLEGDSFKPLVNEYKRAERLLKMGIISEGQAEKLYEQSFTDEGSIIVRRSEIDDVKEATVYLLCSRGLTDAVSEDAIYDILASNKNPDEAASLLVHQAVKNESADNVTAMVIHIDQADGMEIEIPGVRNVRSKNVKTDKYVKNQKTRRSRAEEDDDEENESANIGNIIATIVLIALVAIVVMGGYKLWSRNREAQKEKDTPAYATTQDNSPEDESKQPSEGIDDIMNGDTDADDTNEDQDEKFDQNVQEGNDAAKPDASEDSELVGPDGTTYTVKSGDMLMNISKKFYGDESKYKLIMEANNITDPNKIKIGQVLKIPPLK
jgi:serine/threonine protein phosphatase PrpC